MQFQKAGPADFAAVRQFYWDLIDAMAAENEKIGWKKGVYPTDRQLAEALARGQLYTLTEAGALCACVLLNSDCNPGYAGAAWGLDCPPEQVLIPRALAVDPGRQPGCLVCLAGCPFCTRKTPKDFPARKKRRWKACLPLSTDAMFSEAEICGILEKISGPGPQKERAA